MLPNRAARLAALSMVVGVLIVVVTVVAQLATNDGTLQAVDAVLTTLGLVWIGVSVFLLARAVRAR